jgi:hypothetical protein
VLSHPGAIQPSVKAVIGDPRLDLDLRRVIKLELAMKLPPEIPPSGLPMPQILVAAWQSLREIAQLMLSEQSNRSVKANLNSAINEKVFQPLRTLKAVMHKLAVTAERVPKK